MNRKTADDARRLGAAPAEPDPALSAVATAITSARINGYGPWVAAESALEALDRAGYTVTARAQDDLDAFIADERRTDPEFARHLDATQAAARAQETAQAHGTPGVDAGAEGGGERGAQGESALRATAKRRILEALDRWHEFGLFETSGEFAGVMEAVDDYAAALIPAIRAAIADEIDRTYGPLGTSDDHDEAIQSITSHLRGLCAICGRAPDAEPCGHAHAINLRGEP